VHRQDFQKALRRFEATVSTPATTGERPIAENVKNLIVSKFSSDVWRKGGDQRKYKILLNSAIAGNKDFFRGATADLTRALLAEAQPSHHDAGDHIFEQGGKASSVFIVLSGKGILYTENNTQVRDVIPGDVLGVLSFRWNIKTYLLNARALENISTLTITKESYLTKWASHFHTDFNSIADFIPCFPAFKDAKLNALAALTWTSKINTFPRHSVVPPDLVGSHFCFIVTGECQLMVGPSVNLKSMHALSIIGKGQFFHDISSMLVNHNRRKIKRLAFQCLTETVRPLYPS
jgi:hypothetical protein